MQEISLNILDVAENSVKAGATLVEIVVDEDIDNNLLKVIIKDDGCGMNEETVKSVINPFYTTRTTRKVGLGVPFFKMAAEMTGGKFSIASKEGEGTTVTAEFVYDSIDRMPLGDIAGTITGLVQCNDSIDFIYTHKYRNKDFVMDTREFRKVLGGVPLSTPEVALFIRDYLTENYDNIRS
jgi:anti-sigma regulatory factor (Ser/Thr protein kinase)